MAPVSVIEPIKVSAEVEERAQRLHRESTIFICHDHCIEEEQIRRMTAGGVTAKQLHIGLDVRLWGTPEQFRSSSASCGRPLKAHADPTTSDGFLKSAVIALDYVYELTERTNGEITLALEPADIVAAKKNNRLALLLGAEGARLTEYRLEVLRILVRLGLRHLQLTWAVDNPVGATQNDTSGRGLTDFGRSLIGEQDRLGVIVDISHLSYQAILDAVSASKVAVLNGHSGAKALNSTQPQLLPDEVIQAIAERGGVVAVHFMSQLVKPGRDKASLEHLMAQFEYLVRLVGADHVACGPDYLSGPDRVALNQGISQPFSFAEGVEDISTMFNVTRGLVTLGLSDEDVAKIMGGNLLRLFAEARAGADRSPRAAAPIAEMGVLTGGITPL